MEGNVSMSELKLSVNAAENAAYYTLTYDDAGVYTTEQRSVDESFLYLTLLITSLEDVSLRLYDRDRQLLAEARFDPATQQLLALEP